MGRWINCILACTFLSIIIITHPTQGYRANPELVSRFRREAETVKPLETKSVETDHVTKNVNNTDIETGSSNIKLTKPATRNRGKIKYHTSQFTPKISEKLPNVKEENDHKNDTKVIRSRQYRNVSETALIDSVTESDADKKVKSEDNSFITTERALNVDATDLSNVKSNLDVNNTDSKPNIVEKPNDIHIVQKSSETTTALLDETTINSVTHSSDIILKKNSTEIPSFDISKYISEDFHNKEYQISSNEETTFMSLQVHNPEEAVKGIRPIDLSRFEGELTTPKTVLFDEHHSALKDDIKNKLAAENGGEDSESKIDINELAEKAKTDNNTKVEILTVKELYNNDKIGDDGHIHKELISTKGEKIQYETSKLETNLDDLDSDSNDNLDGTLKSDEVTEASSSVVTTKSIQKNSTEFVNNLDVKVREVFPELSTSTPKINIHTPANVITIPVIDASSNTTHPRLRISVKANKPFLQNDPETVENLVAKASNRGQKSYLASTPQSLDNSKSANEIQQAQETVHGTTKSFRQLNSFTNSENDDEKYNMNLPDSADAWSLIGMKHVPTQKRNISVVTDTPINIKELLDWSEIMKNERNSSVNVASFSTPKNNIKYPAETQGEENKLIPVQVPAPTKTPSLVVENNIPSNDITTIKPEEVIEKNIAHTTTIHTTKDYGDNLQFNRVDDFEIISPSANIEKINITFKNSAAINVTGMPVLTETEPTTRTSATIAQDVTTEQHQKQTSTEEYQIYKPIRQLNITKDHKKPMTIDEVKMQMILEEHSNRSTQDMPPTTSNILEFHGTSVKPNILMMSPEQTDVSTTQKPFSTTENKALETTSVDDIIQLFTEFTTDLTEDQATTTSNSPTSYEMMYNDSPSLPTETSQSESTFLEEEITTAIPNYSTELDIFLSTTSNTFEDLATETETTITETPTEYATPAIDISTEFPMMNISSSIFNDLETTLSSNSRMEETTFDNTIAKMVNVTEISKEGGILHVHTTPKPIFTTPSEILNTDDFIDEYQDNTEGNELNVNSMHSNNEEILKNTSPRLPVTIIEDHGGDMQTEIAEIGRRIPTSSSKESLQTKIMPAGTTVETVLEEATTVKELLEPVQYFSTTLFSSSSTTDDPNGVLGSHEPPEESGAVAAITISAVGVIALIILVALLYVMRKRQSKRTYGQRCTPVSLDAYSVDSVSVYSSVRGKNRARASKRSYGNPAYNDSGMTSHSMSFPALSNFISDESAVFAEFTEIPTVTVRADEVPAGCEVKNRYANVMPLPETRVPLSAQPGDETGGYINANYVRGPRGIRNYYIACQAPMQSTVNDFWRMIWEQQTKVILMLTDLYENGVEKCTDYLPPSEVLDCHRLFGDYKVTLKKREVKDKYVISNVQLCNMESGTWREVTHLWYMWPEKGVPKEYQSMIAFLIEARSFMKSPHDKTENNNTPSAEKTIQQAKKDGCEQINVYSPQQAQKSYRKAHRAPTEPPSKCVDGDATKSNGCNGESSSKGAQVKTTTTSMCRLSTINEKSPNGSVSEPPCQFSTAPVVVHCSPGTGRTGAVIACDLAIKEFELNRTVDLPKTVYRIRRDRASAVQTKEQYMFIYQVINLYATKLTGGVLDSI